MRDFLEDYRRRQAEWQDYLRLFSVAVLLSAVSILTFGYVSPEAQVFGRVYWQADTSQKIVALSFDDGPNEPYTSAVLEVLARYGVKATFFVIGQNAKLYPETVKRMVSEGHVLGNHSYSHNANHALFDNRADIERGEETYFSIAGVRPALYRPPHNKKSPWELAFVRGLGLTPVTWGVGTAEGQGASPEQAAREIVGKAYPGCIIAMHDGWGTNHTDPRSYKSLPAQALPEIIEGLQARGYSFVTIPELLGIEAYK
jgi:peptidoglycan/xylan/chitin deacetylase (PgdA/CDA1 family)